MCCWACWSWWASFWFAPSRFDTASAWLAAACWLAAVAAAKLLRASAAAPPWALFEYALAEATPFLRSIFCSARSVALEAAHVCATTRSLCHYFMAKAKRWDRVMALHAAVSVCPSKSGWLDLSAMKRQSSMPLAYDSRSVELSQGALNLLPFAVSCARVADLYVW